MFDGCKVEPVGLEIMAHAIKTENKLMEEQQQTPEYEARYLDVPEYMTLKKKAHKLFTPKDLATKDNYLAACLIYFFSRPVEFKNEYPSLYTYFNKKLYQRVSQPSS